MKPECVNKLIRKHIGLKRVQNVEMDWKDHSGWPEKKYDIGYKRDPQRVG